MSHDELFMEYLSRSVLNIVWFKIWPVFYHTPCNTQTQYYQLALLYPDLQDEVSRKTAECARLQQTLDDNLLYSTSRQRELQEEIDMLKECVREAADTAHKVWAAGINSLAPGEFEWNFRYVIFKEILVIDAWGISCKIALIWMSLDFTDDQSTLVQVMAWCCQAPSHYLSQYWPRSLSPYGVTRPEWVNSLLPSDALCCYRTWSPLLRVIAFCLTAVTPSAVTELGHHCTNVKHTKLLQ